MTGNTIAHNSQACNQRLVAIGDALYAIGGKWKLRIILALRSGNTRFNELQRIIPGISAKMLSNELKELELNGFVKRAVYAGTPVLVEYQVTPYADTLHNILEALSEWGIMHKDKIRKQAGK
jgi:DNA-binding HxlR family transcriptional regulator